MRYNKKTKIQKKQKKKRKKKKRKKTHNTHTKEYQKKELFNQFFLFLVGVRISFFDNLPKKRAPKKHHKNRGFSKVFGKQMCVTKRPFLDQKNPKPEIPIIFFFAFFFSFNNKKHKNC